MLQVYGKLTPVDAACAPLGFCPCQFGQTSHNKVLYIAQGFPNHGVQTQFVKCFVCSGHYLRLYDDDFRTTKSQIYQAVSYRLADCRPHPPASPASGE